MYEKGKGMLSLRWLIGCAMVELRQGYRVESSHAARGASRF